MENQQNMFAEAFNRIEEGASKAIALHEKDYIYDGLWYCHKCNTPKQCRVELFGKIRTPMCICKCEVERLKKEKEEQERRKKEERIAKYRKAGFHDSDMQKWTFAVDDGMNQKITKIAMNYVDNFDEMLKRGKGLLFYGEVGTGKTFYAACIANALIDSGYPCLMTDFPRLEKTISGMFEGKQDYIDGLNRFPLLVIDDLSRERDTSYMNEIVQDVINSRYQAGLPTIITTNLTKEEISHPKDINKQRPYSRLLEMCFPVKVEGKDRRREKLKEDHAELKDLLGL